MLAATVAAIPRYLPPKRSSPRLFRCRDHSELLHEAQLIHAKPVLGDPSVPHAHDVYERQRHRLAGCGDAEKLVRVRAAEGLLGHDLVALGEHVLDREPRIRERVQEAAQEHLPTLTIAGDTGRRTVVDERGIV